MTLEEKEKLEKELEELNCSTPWSRRAYQDCFVPMETFPEIVSMKQRKMNKLLLKGQISSLETKIRYAEIVNSDAVAQDEVAIGKTVTIQEVGEDEEEVYIIVGSAGADAFAGKVSNESPIGRALIGKKTGDTATIETPVGSYDVKILKVEKTA